MILIIIQVILFISGSITKAAESRVNSTLVGCPTNCEGVMIPYPFGIGPECAIPGFELNCTATTDGIFTPYLGNLTIWDINISSGQARINMPVSYQCYGNTTSANSSFSYTVDWTGTPFQINHERNIITIIGCNAFAYLFLGNSENWYTGVTGCIPECDRLHSLSNGSCSGIGCCQATIPETPNIFSYYFSDQFSDANNSIPDNFPRCSYAVMMENTDFFVKSSYITTDELIGQNMSVVIDWAIGNTTCNTARTNKSTYACKSNNSICLNSSTSPGYLCNCSDGYQGNPYLEGGCQGYSLQRRSHTTCPGLIFEKKDSALEFFFE